jgi:phosphate transport system substrate-binding protein
MSNPTLRAKLPHPSCVCRRSARERRRPCGWRLLALGLWFALLLASCSPGEGAGSLTITGSTSVTPFAEHLAELYQHEHPGAVINIQGLGSSAGIRAAIDGVAEIGMSSRELKPEELAQLDQVVIAHDALALIVNPANPIDHLSGEQIRAIFTGALRSWAEVGGQPRPIVLVSREAGSGTFGAFEELVMQGKPITSTALRQGSNGAIRQIVAEDPNAIGYISLGIVDSTVKALAIDDVQPSTAHVEAGQYRLVRPFLFVWRKHSSLSPLATDFVDYVLSPAGQAELEQAGLVKGAVRR